MSKIIFGRNSVTKKTEVYTITNNGHVTGPVGRGTPLEVQHEAMTFRSRARMAQLNKSAQDSLNRSRKLRGGI